MLSSYTLHCNLIDSRSSVRIISHIKNCCKTVFTDISSFKIYVTLVLNSLRTLCSFYAWLHQRSYFSSRRTIALMPRYVQLELRIIKKISLQLRTQSMAIQSTRTLRKPSIQSVKASQKDKLILNIPG